MAYKVIILYQLYMPSYFLGTFTEYPFRIVATSYNTSAYTIFISGVFNSTVNIYVQVSHSKSSRVKTFAVTGRSSDLLLSGRLPVVHIADSGRSIVRIWL